MEIGETLTLRECAVQNPTFRSDASWVSLFQALDLQLLVRRRLSRLRDWSYPVARSFYVLRTL